MNLVEQEEAQGNDHGYDGGQSHAFQLNGAEGDGCAGEAGDHGHGGEDQVSRLGVVHVLFNEHPDAAGGDEAEEEDAYAAHDGNGNGVDQSGNFSDEGEDDGKDCSAADDPGAVYAGHGHDAHVFAVGGIRRGAGKAGENVGQAVRHEGTVQAGVLDEVSSDDVAGDEEVAQMFREDDEEGGEDHQNGGKVKLRGIEGGQGEPRHFFHFGEVDHAEGGGEEVSCNDADQDGDDGKEASPQDGGEDGDNQGEHGNGNGGAAAHTLRFADEARHGHRQRSQLEPDDGYNGAHGSRREEDVNPADADLFDKEPQDDEAEAEGNEAALGIRIGHARRGGDGQNGGDEGKGRAQISGKLPFAEGQVYQCADAVHEKAGRRVYMEQERNQYGGAEHGKEMLQTEWNGGKDGKSFLHPDDSMGHFVLLEKRIFPKKEAFPDEDLPPWIFL